MWLRISLIFHVWAISWIGNTIVCDIFVINVLFIPTPTTTNTPTLITMLFTTITTIFWDCSHTVTWQISIVSLFSIIIPSIFIIFSSSFIIVFIKFTISSSQNTPPPSTCITICAISSYLTIIFAYISVTISSNSLHASSSQSEITSSLIITIIGHASFSSIKLISTFSLCLISSLTSFASITETLLTMLASSTTSCLICLFLISITTILSSYELLCFIPSSFLCSILLVTHFRWHSTYHASNKQLLMQWFCSLHWLNSIPTWFLTRNWYEA